MFISIVKDIISNDIIVAGLILVESALACIYTGGQAVITLLWVIHDRISPHHKSADGEFLRFLVYVTLLVICVFVALWTAKLAL